MSLILDALRKSEAERRRGESPGLHASRPAAPAATRDAWRQWPILVGGLLVLLAVAILFWPQAPSPESTSSAPTPSAHTDAAAPESPELASPGPPAPPPASSTSP